jgi:hypothetical protein
MTTLLGFLLSVSVFTFGFASKTPHTSSIGNIGKISALQSEKSLTFTDSTFSVNNETSVDVGWLTVHSVGYADSYINITGSGNFSTTLPYYASGCEIHGQSFPQSVPTRIIIDAHTSVRVTWTSNIIVVDIAETY